MRPVGKEVSMYNFYYKTGGRHAGLRVCVRVGAPHSPSHSMWKLREMIRSISQLPSPLLIRAALCY